ncbi:MAG: HAMP domain-containing sensor histidine kinase, partial [Rhodovibrionaceae bacterium]
NLINDILDLSKIEAGRYELNEEEIEVDACVQRCLALFREKFEEKSLKVSYEPQGLWLYADERAFKQVLINLLSNAIKFTPLQGTIETACLVEGKNFLMEVRDSGCGIDSKDLKRVMEPFGQAANAMRSSEGTGLGLSISKSLAELHGGKLSLESTPGLGTKVTLSLPGSRLRTPGTQLAARA